MGNIPLIKRKRKIRDPHTEQNTSTAVGIVAGIAGGWSSSSCGTARQSLVRFQKRKHVITFCSLSSFQTPADTSNIHRKAQTGAMIYGIKHTHKCEWHRMTRMTRPDCAVMCNLINTHTHTNVHS